MKRILLAASIFTAAATFAGNVNVNASTNTVLSRDGKHIPASQVPAPVIASFNSNFPSASNAQWEKEKEHGQTVYQADFLNNGKKWRAVFAADGTLLKSGRK